MNEVNVNISDSEVAERVIILLYIQGWNFGILSFI
jgi:hypothetical protein